MKKFDLSELTIEELYELLPEQDKTIADFATDENFKKFMKETIIGLQNRNISIDDTFLCDLTKEEDIEECYKDIEALLTKIEKSDQKQRIHLENDLQEILEISPLSCLFYNKARYKKNFKSFYEKLEKYKLFIKKFAGNLGLFYKANNLLESAITNNKIELAWYLAKQKYSCNIGKIFHKLIKRNDDFANILILIANNCKKNKKYLPINKVLLDPFFSEHKIYLKVSKRALYKYYFILRLRDYPEKTEDTLKIYKALKNINYVDINAYDNFINKETLEIALKKGTFKKYSLPHIGCSEHSFIHSSLKYGWPEYFNLLLKFDDLDVNQQNLRSGYDNNENSRLNYGTPILTLIRASEKLDPDRTEYFVKELVKRGADLKYVNKRGESVLMAAIHHQCVPVLKACYNNITPDILQQTYQMDGRSCWLALYPEISQILTSKYPNMKDGAGMTYAEFKNYFNSFASEEMQQDFYKFLKEYRETTFDFITGPWHFTPFHYENNGFYIYVSPQAQEAFDLHLQKNGDSLYDRIISREILEQAAKSPMVDFYDIKKNNKSSDIQPENIPYCITEDENVCLAGNEEPSLDKAISYKECVKIKPINYKEWKDILNMDIKNVLCDRDQVYSLTGRDYHITDGIDPFHFYNIISILEMNGDYSDPTKKLDRYILMNKVFLEFDKLYAQRAANGEILPNKYIRQNKEYKVKNGKIVNLEKYETSVGHFHKYGLNMFRNHHKNYDDIGKENEQLHFELPQKEL